MANTKHCVLIFALSSIAPWCLAESASLKMEEILIRGTYTPNETSVISRDAESLLATAGEVNDPVNDAQLLPDAPSEVLIRPDDDEGIPRFVALGVNLSF